MNHETGYEHMGDAEFWGEVRSLLEVIERCNPPDFSLVARVGTLADYVRDEAEARDPVLAANAQRRLTMIHVAGRRANAAPDDLATHFTPAEDAEFDRLWAAYARRLAAFAKAGGNPARRTEIRITRGPADLRGRNYTGRSADTIARRLFGRLAYAQPSADPANRGQGMILRDARRGGGSHVLAEYVQH